MDEATPHLHIDFIPYVTGSRRGLETRVSLKKALKALGFKGGTRSETERNQWYAYEKEQLSALMLNHGIEWEKKGTHEKHLSVLDFKKKERSREVEELEAKKFELQSENQAYQEISENLKKQLTELDDEVHTIQDGMEKSRKEAENARKQADKYQKRMQELAPMVKDMEHLAVKFSDDPDQVLPEAGSIESGRAYREKKAKPLMEKMVKVLRSVYGSYLDVSRKFDKLQLSYNRTVEKANHLSSRFHEVYTENQELKGIVRDYECVREVLGKEKVSGIVQMEKQREQLLKEQKRIERRKQNKEAR